jgi:hypothetical protein
VSPHVKKDTCTTTDDTDEGKRSASIRRALWLQPESDLLMDGDKRAKNIGRCRKAWAFRKILSFRILKT